MLKLLFFLIGVIDYKNVNGDPYLIALCTFVHFLCWTIRIAEIVSKQDISWKKFT